jgi:hypothetical protein
MIRATTHHVFIEVAVAWPLTWAFATGTANGPDDSHDLFVPAQKPLGRSLL